MSDEIEHTCNDDPVGGMGPAGPGNCEACQSVDETHSHDLPWLEGQARSRGLPDRGDEETVDEFRRRVQGEIEKTERRRNRVLGFRIDSDFFAQIFSPTSHMVMGDLPGDAELVHIEERRHEKCVVAYLRSVQFQPVSPGSAPPVEGVVTITDHGCPSALHALLAKAFNVCAVIHEGSPIEENIDLRALLRSIVFATREILPECSAHASLYGDCPAQSSDDSREMYFRCSLPAGHWGSHFDGHVGERF